MWDSAPDAKTVIASEAKQSILQRKERMDCFVASAPRNDELSAALRRIEETKNVCISGERRRSHAEVSDRADRIAGGLQKLGVKQGDCVCILMRNDIAFIETAYAAMRLGAYGVPVNWHFKPEEINYILKDSGTPVLIGHADMLHQLQDAIPNGVTVLSVPTPPEILANYKTDPDQLATPDFAIDLES